MPRNSNDPVAVVSSTLIRALSAPSGSDTKFVPTMDSLTENTSWKFSSTDVFDGDRFTSTVKSLASDVPFPVASTDGWSSSPPMAHGSASKAKSVPAIVIVPVPVPPAVPVRVVVVDSTAAPEEPVSGAAPSVSPPQATRVRTGRRRRATTECDGRWTSGSTVPSPLPNVAIA